MHGRCDERAKPIPSQSLVVSEVYRTVAGRGQDRFEVRGSDFIGHVDTAATIAEAERFIDSVSTEYNDATHNIPTYRVRAEPLREYSDDDGEPGGSAGKPALNVLQQEAVENVVAVVTRYYGGTNLGVGGLARSYSRAVKDALDEADIVEQRPHERFTIAVEYDDSGTVRGILESTGVEFEADYAETVTFAVSVPITEGADLRDRIRSATSGRASLHTETNQ
nr:YigZ family protein [Halovenus rubra]